MGSCYICARRNTLLQTQNEIVRAIWVFFHARALALAQKERERVHLQPWRSLYLFSLGQNWAKVLYSPVASCQGAFWEPRWVLLGRLELCTVQATGSATTSIWCHSGEGEEQATHSSSPDLQGARQGTPVTAPLLFLPPELAWQGKVAMRHSPLPLSEVGHFPGSEKGLEGCSSLFSSLFPARWQSCSLFPGVEQREQQNRTPACFLYW